VENQVLEAELKNGRVDERRPEKAGCAPKRETESQSVQYTSKE